MGTRSLICVFKNGEYKVAQYAQWDGYPEGQGVIILDYLKKWNRNKFEKSLNTIRWITNTELEGYYIGVGINPRQDFITLEESIRFKYKYPYLDRDMGAEILNYIELNKNLKLKNSLLFANDSLFCEWAYVIDLDKNKFEIYEGYNEEVLSENERFYSKDLENCPQYYPVKFLISFDLDDLPNEEDFIEKVESLLSNEEDEVEEMLGGASNE